MSTLVISTREGCSWRRSREVLWCALRWSEVLQRCLQKYWIYTEHNSTTPLCWSFLYGPKRVKHERPTGPSVRSMVAGDWYGPCWLLLTNQSPKKSQTEDSLVERSFSNLFSPCRNAPRQTRSKLYSKRWAQSDTSHVALLKRDLSTSQSSEEKHCKDVLLHYQCFEIQPLPSTLTEQTWAPSHRASQSRRAVRGSVLP